MSRIDDDIKKGEFARIYLLYGDEDYLKTYNLGKLTDALIPPDDTINLSRWQGKDIDLNELEDQIQTLPFFAAWRLIILEETGFFKKSDDNILRIFSAIPDSTVVVFLETETDARGKLYKLAKSIGVLHSCSRLKDKELSDWALRRLGREGKRIQRSAMELLLQRTGPDMNAVSNEINKLVSYTLDRQDILLEDVQTLVSAQAEEKAYLLAEQAALGERTRALVMYHDLLSAKTAPLLVLYFLSKTLTDMLSIKEMRDNGLDAATIADKTGQKLFIVRKNISMCSRYSFAQIRRLLKLCSDTDFWIKSGRIDDETGVELVIIQMARRG